jgi:hypothetical protein
MADAYGGIRNPTKIDTRTIPTQQIQEAAANAAGKPSQVADACIGIDARLTDLQDRLDSLEKRLYPILRSRPPEPEGQEGKAVEPVQLAQALQTFSARVQHCSDTVGSILQRLEL